MGLSILHDGKVEPNNPPKTAEQEAEPSSAVGAEEDRGISAAAQGGEPATAKTASVQQQEAARQPKTDWVEEAYKCFIKDAGDIDPTDPVKAVEAYFQKNATDELKARCKAEGKDAKECWRFIEAVARKALHGSSGHIDPGVVYAIAMHWFEDVPKDWDSASAKATARQAKPKKAGAKARQPKKPAETPAETRKEKAKAKPKAKKPAETPAETRKEKAKAKPKAKKPKQQQGFFFEMLEAPSVGGEGRGDESPRTGQESEVG